MKTKKRTKNIKKPLLIITAVLLVAIVAFLVYLFVFKPHNDKSANTTMPQDSSSNQQQPQKTDTTTPTDNKEKATNTDVPAAPTTTQTSSKKQVQMVASVDQSNGTVYIRGGVNYPVSGGSCYALLSGPSGQSIQKDSVVLPNPASTDCKTIAIQASDLSSGKWTFTLHYTSDEYEGVSSEISFTI